MSSEYLVSLCPELSCLHEVLGAGASLAASRANSTDDINNEDNLIYFFIGHSRPPGPSPTTRGPRPAPRHINTPRPRYHFGQMMQPGRGEEAASTHSLIQN